MKKNAERNSLLSLAILISSLLPMKSGLAETTPWEHEPDTEWGNIAFSCLYTGVNDFCALVRCEDGSLEFGWYGSGGAPFDLGGIWGVQIDNFFEWEFALKIDGDSPNFSYFAHLSEQSERFLDKMKLGSVLLFDLPNDTSMVFTLESARAALTNVEKNCYR